jgi:hypothetical protein
MEIAFRNDQSEENSQTGYRTEEEKERKRDRKNDESGPGDERGWGACGPPPEPDVWGCKQLPCASYEEVV